MDALEPAFILEQGGNFQGFHWLLQRDPVNSRGESTPADGPDPACGQN